MQTYKIIFSCQSVLNTVPDAQMMFGTICNIIKSSTGEDKLNAYFNSFKSDAPFLLHSSMFLNGYLPMLRKNIYSLRFINQLVELNENEEKISIFENVKKYKKIDWMSEDIYHEYGMEKTFNELSIDLIQKTDNFTVENGYLSKSNNNQEVEHVDILLTRNGFSEDGKKDKSLFYTKQMYYPIGTEFSMFVKTTLSIDQLTKIFRYVEYFGIGNRRSVGMNCFRLERIEKTNLKSKQDYKFILSKYIPTEEIEYNQSYYALSSQIYRASKDYANHVITGKYTHILEGSYMKMKENKEFYGDLIEMKANDKVIYHYAIGFTF